MDPPNVFAAAALGGSCGLLASSLRGPTRSTIAKLSASSTAKARSELSENMAGSPALHEQLAEVPLGRVDRHREGAAIWQQLAVGVESNRRVRAGNRNYIPTDVREENREPLGWAMNAVSDGLLDRCLGCSHRGLAGAPECEGGRNKDDPAEHVWPTSLTWSRERRCGARRLQGLVGRLSYQSSTKQCPRGPDLEHPDGTSCCG